MKNSFRRLWDSYFRDKSRDEHDPWSHYGPKLARLREYLPRDGRQTVALSGSLIMFRPSRQERANKVFNRAMFFLTIAIAVTLWLIGVK